MDKEKIYGMYNPDGSIARDAYFCILTGKLVGGPKGGASQRTAIPGTPYFYKVSVSAVHRVTDDMRKQWAKDAPPVSTASVRKESDSK